jgi:hypothetical protein
MVVADVSICTNKQPDLAMTLEMSVSVIFANIYQNALSRSAYLCMSLSVGVKSN